MVTFLKAVLGIVFAALITVGVLGALGVLFGLPVVTVQMPDTRDGQSAGPLHRAKCLEVGQE